VKPEVDREIRMIFQLPQLPRQPVLNLTLLAALSNSSSSGSHHNPILAFLVLIRDDTLRPAHEPFTMKEPTFSSTFLHPQTSEFQKLVTTGCHVHTTKTFLEVKKCRLEDHTMMDWLHMNHMFLTIFSTST